MLHQNEILLLSGSSSETGWWAKRDTVSEVRRLDSNLDSISYEMCCSGQAT